VILFSFLFCTGFTLVKTDSTLKGWNAKTLTFTLNTANCPSNVLELINPAMALWNNVVSINLKVVKGNDTSTTVAQLQAGTATDTPTIACDPNFSTTIGTSADSIPGVAYVTSPATGGHISYAYLLLNVESGSGANISSYNADLVKVIIAHEIGHVLGLGHSADPNALMYYDASAKTTLGLAQDDIDGITYLYYRDELSSDTMFGGCGLVKAVSGGGHGGGGSANKLIIVLLLLAPLLFAAWLRRRKRFALVNNL
jgi:hypothetical protein